LGNNFIAAAVNDSGVVVWSDLIYSGGTVQNLNNLIPAGSGYQIQYAKAINDKGQIVADAYTPTYQTHTLLLTPPCPPPPGNARNARRRAHQPALPAGPSW